MGMYEHLLIQKCFRLTSFALMVSVIVAQGIIGVGSKSAAASRASNNYPMTSGMKNHDCIDTSVFAQTFYSGRQIITCVRFNDTTYYLRDRSKGKGIITLRSGDDEGGDYISRMPGWFFQEKDQFALDVHYGVSQTYMFYKTLFNRNSIDNNGCAIFSYVNDPNFPDNAVWYGNNLRIGNQTISGNGIATLDIIGHELTHGVTAHTSRLRPGGESGAISESISDIMGKSIEFWSDPNASSWIISNKMNYKVRDMSDPKLYNQPDTYKDIALWYRGGSSDKNDHINSGVGNYMFYLLVNGGEGTNSNGKQYKVRKIGLGASDSIIYRCETVYLQSNSQYCDWRDACIRSATDLFGQGSVQLQSVKDAWRAVGVPSCREIYR